jgi:hypothetical protein
VITSAKLHRNLTIARRYVDCDENIEGCTIPKAQVNRFPYCNSGFNFNSDSIASAIFRHTFCYIIYPYICFNLSRIEHGS